MKFKRILCGVDFSQPSVLAFDAAVELSRLLKAELHIMHVIEAYPAASEALDETAISLEEKATDAMEALLSTASLKFNGLPVTTEVTRGRAYVEILNRARDREIDLIILGAKGLALIEEAFSGSTAERVMKEAACSVLIMKG